MMKHTTEAGETKESTKKVRRSGHREASHRSPAWGDLEVCSPVRGRARREYSGGEAELITSAGEHGRGLGIMH